MENVHRASDRVDDWFGVSTIEGSGPPRRRTFIPTAILPRIHQRYDGAPEWGLYRRGQLTLFRWSGISEVEEAANQAENGRHVEGTVGEEAEASGTYCSLTLADSSGGSRDSHIRWVPVSYPQGGFAHVRGLLERANHPTRGHVHPRSFVACLCGWAGGRRPPTPGRAC